VHERGRTETRARTTPRRGCGDALPSLRAWGQSCGVHRLSRMIFTANLRGHRERQWIWDRNTQVLSIGVMLLKRCPARYKTPRTKPNSPHSH